MMPHPLQSDSRPVLERWAMQHFKIEIWETVLFHDPGVLPETAIAAIENRVLADAKKLVSSLGEDRLRDPRDMNIMIGDAGGETMALLRKKASELAWKQQWNRGRRRQEVR